MTIFTTIRPIILLLIVILHLNSFSQYKFQKTYKGLTFIYGHQTDDGGYIVTGTTKIFGAGNDDIFLLKLNPLGQTEWLKTYGSSSKEMAGQVQQTYDGGFIIVGTTYGFGLSADIYLIKTDNNGDTLWTRAYGTPNAEMGWSVQQTPDSGFIFCGQTQITSSNKDIYLAKADLQGNLQWTKTFGGIKDDVSYCVNRTNDNGFIITGATLSFGSEPDENIYLIKTNSVGDTLWSKAYSCFIEEWGQSVIQTSDGGFIIVSSIFDFGAGAFDIYVVKTGSEGEIIWAKTYGTNLDDAASCIKQTNDGGYIIAGGSRSFNGSIGQYDIYIIKINSVGDTLWTRIYGRNTETDYGVCAAQTIDGGYVIFGNSSNYNGTGNFFSYLIKTDENGNTVCNNSFNSTQINNAPTSVYSATGIINSSGTEKKVATIMKDTTISDSTLCVACGTVSINYDEKMCKGDKNEITVITSVNSSFKWNPIETLSCFDCPNPTAKPDSSESYFLNVKDIYGCESNDSIFITVDSCPKDIFIPNIFSPNNDGVNDYFTISGIGKIGWTLHIFNRWGELMYTTDLPSEKYWSGRTFSGKEVTQGVYYYVLENPELNLIYKGIIHLMK